MNIAGYDAWKLSSPWDDCHEIGTEDGEQCGRFPEVDDDAPRAEGAEESAQQVAEIAGMRGRDGGDDEDKPKIGEPLDVKPFDPGNDSGRPALPSPSDPSEDSAGDEPPQYPPDPSSTDEPPQQEVVGKGADEFEFTVTTVQRATHPKSSLPQPQSRSASTSWSWRASWPSRSVRR